MSSAAEGRNRKLPYPGEADGADLQGSEDVVPYDEGLLERARIQWQFGDWRSLTNIDRSVLQHHPNRAKLSLLVAAGYFQIGGIEKARQFVRLAEDWGCDNKLLIKVVSAGVHNSLARAAALSGDYQCAFKHFESAIKLGASDTDIRLLSKARASEQLAQLGLVSSQTLVPEIERSNESARPVSFSGLSACQQSAVSFELFFSDEEVDRAHFVEEIWAVVGTHSEGRELPAVSWSSAVHRGKEYFFVHFSGDYIPAKIKEKNQFYESAFLNLLARLHQPGKLIVDGGANIGNHTVFFAGVIGANVVAFEPQAFNYEFLVANVCLNSLANNVDPRRIALGARPGRMSLVQALPDNYGSFTSDPDHVKRAKDESQNSVSYEVEVSTIDFELSCFESEISIIKLDLEGGELEALYGARGVIEKSKPVIAVECFTKHLYSDVKEFLSGFGYFVIDSANATPTFIFLTKNNPLHVETLSRYLEQSSVGKYSANTLFSQNN